MKLRLTQLILIVLLINAIATRNNLKTNTKIPDNYKQARKATLVTHQYRDNPNSQPFITTSDPVVIYKSKKLKLNEKSKNKQNEAKEVYDNTWSIGMCAMGQDNKIEHYETSKFKEGLIRNTFKVFSHENSSICKGSHNKLLKYRIPVNDLEFEELSSETILVSIVKKDEIGRDIWRLSFEIEYDLGTQLETMRRGTKVYIANALEFYYKRSKIAQASGNKNQFDEFKEKFAKHFLENFELDDNTAKLRSEIVNNFFANAMSKDPKEFLDFYLSYCERDHSNTIEELTKRATEMDKKHYDEQTYEDLINMTKENYQKEIELEEAAKTKKGAELSPEELKKHHQIRREERFQEKQAKYRKYNQLAIERENKLYWNNKNKKSQWPF